MFMTMFKETGAIKLYFRYPLLYHINKRFPQEVHLVTTV